MKHIRDILKGKQVNSLNSLTVNSNKNNNISTVNSNNTVNSKETVNGKYLLSEKIQELLENHSYAAEDIASMLAEGLEDEKSLSYYLILAKEHSHARLLEAMHITKDDDRNEKIRTNKAIYFQAILRRWGFKTKFKEKE